MKQILILDRYGDAAPELRMVTDEELKELFEDNNVVEEGLPTACGKYIHHSGDEMDVLVISEQ